MANPKKLGQLVDLPSGSDRRRKTVAERSSICSEMVEYDRDVPTMNIKNLDKKTVD